MEVKQSAIARNKLILLYILKSAGIQLSDSRMIHICQQFSLMDYFDFSSSIADLTENDLCVSFQAINGTFYSISETGISTLEYFEKELPHSIREQIRSYCAEQRDRFLLDSQLFGESIRLSDDRYRVTLKILENNMSVFEINLLCSSQSEASKMVNAWKERARDVYGQLFENLLS